MDQIAAVIGHLAWPATVIGLGLILLKELKAGLLVKILPHGWSIEAGAFKLQTNAARAAARNAAVPLEEHLDIEPEKGLTPYDQVMDAWRELATAVTAAAVRHGGVEDQRRIYANLDILRASGEYEEGALDSVGELFQARNSARKQGADRMAEEDAVAFVGTATALSRVFAQ